MAQYYYTATAYVSSARTMLQDLVGPPYRFTDAQIIDALNLALDELGRLRPDIFLDLKYQRPLTSGDIGDGNPGPYTTADIAFTGGGAYDLANGTPIPVPNRYRGTIEWFIPGWLQLYDMTDTQDQRAVAFLQKFQAHLLTLAAA